MTISPEYREFVAELLAPLGPVGIRSMFGGAGVYYGGVMFGLIADETLYFKVDDDNRGDFEHAGKGPFTYEGKNGRRMVMAYYEVPEELFDEAEELRRWARKAVDAALRADKAKPPARRRAGGESPRGSRRR